MAVHSSEIRQFVITYFNDEDLNALCFDRLPAVYENFATGMTKGQKIQLLLDYCVRHEALPQLLRMLQTERPQEYRNWIGQLEAKDDSPMSPVSWPPAFDPNSQMTNISGGLNLTGDTITINGDAIGRDKIESAGGHIIHAAAGATVIINASSSNELLANARFQQAEILLAEQNYQEAERLLSVLVQENPTEPHVRLLYALALLRGRNPCKLLPNQVKHLERQLAQLRLQAETRALASVVLAVIKHDYYLINGMDEGSPSFEQLCADVRAQPIAAVDQPLLQHLYATRQAQQRLNMSW